MYGVGRAIDIDCTFLVLINGNLLWKWQLFMVMFSSQGRSLGDDVMQWSYGFQDVPKEDWQKGDRDLEFYWGHLSALKKHL